MTLQRRAALALALTAAVWGGAHAQDKLAGVGCEPYKGTPEQFAALVREDLPKWARIVKDSGATID